MKQSNGISQEVNKKILGTKKVTYKDIKFKSKLESTCYKKLEEAAINTDYSFDFYYEPEKIILWEGFKPSNIKIYAPNSSKYHVGNMSEQTKKTLNITYTPDFLVIKGDYRIYFDVKGMPNDTYPIKKKMFLKVLEQDTSNLKYIFMEPHNVKQINQSIDIIKNL